MSRDAHIKLSESREEMSRAVAVGWMKSKVFYFTGETKNLAFFLALTADCDIDENTKACWGEAGIDWDAVGDSFGEGLVTRAHPSDAELSPILPQTDQMCSLGRSCLRERGTLLDLAIAPVGASLFP